ncbi:MAG: nitroreductase family protein [Polyangia bacterium]|jgi:nitroreductase
MEFAEVVKQRRSLRSFAPVEVNEALIKELAAVAGLAPSCSNKQPWRFVFVRSPAVLERMVATMKPGNAAWAKAASLIVVVWSQADLDCRTPEGRDYYQFDTGMAAALLMLAATERNLSAHPIAGFDPEAARQALALPDGAQVITLIVVGGHTQEISPALAAWQIAAETERPARLPFEAFATIV